MLSLHFFKLSEMKDSTEETEEWDVIHFSIWNISSLSLSEYIVATEDGTFFTKGTMTIKNTSEQSLLFLSVDNKCWFTEKIRILTGFIQFFRIVSFLCNAHVFCSVRLVLSLIRTKVTYSNLKRYSTFFDKTGCKPIWNSSRVMRWADFPKQSGNQLSILIGNFRVGYHVRLCTSHLRELDCIKRTKI